MQFILRSTIFVLLFFFFISLVIAYKFSNSNTPSHEPTAAEIAAKTEQDDLIEVRVNAKHYVEKQLKSPASAKWPNLADVAVARVKNTKNRWLVNGYVDSQNSFGAMIRTKYWATMAKDNNGTWSLIKLQTQP